MPELSSALRLTIFPQYMWLLARIKSIGSSTESGTSLCSVKSREVPLKFVILSTLHTSPNFYRCLSVLLLGEFIKLIYIVKILTISLSFASFLQLNLQINKQKQVIRSRQVQRSTYALKVLTSIMSFRIIFEFILYRFIMFPFKQIKSSLSNQKLTQQLPPSYPTLVSSQSQLQIRRERINPVPKYDIQPKSTENLSQFRVIYNPHPTNSTPLTFNMNPNYKNKIKKTTRPSSRGGNKTLEGPPSRRNQVEDFRPEQRGYLREKLQDFSRTTSTLFNNFSFQASEQYQNIKKESTPEKIYTLVKNKQESFKEWTPTYGRNIKTQNIQTPVISKTSPKINFINGFSTQPFAQNLQKRGLMPSEAYLLQDLKNQKETIENFQREVLRLNTEIRQFKNSNQHLLRQYDDIAKQLRNKDEKKIDENIFQWQKELNGKMLIQIQKMQKQLAGKNSLNLYLQQQCNLYNENYKKQLAESNRMKDQYKKQKQKLNTTIWQLKKQLEEKQKIKPDQTIIKQFQSQLCKKEEKIENLKKINDLYLSKIQKQQHDIEIDKSEINMLLMKLENLQSKSQQLAAQLQKNSKKYQEDLFKEKQTKIEQLLKFNQQLSEKSCELINMEQKWRLSQQQYKQIENEHKQVQNYCKQVQQQKISIENQMKNLKRQFQNQIQFYEKEYKVSEQTCSIKEQLIVQYLSKIDSFNERQKVKEEKMLQMQTKYEEICKENKKILEQKTELTIKLKEFLQKLNIDEHFECRISIQKAKQQLKSIKSQKQQLLLKFKNLQGQRNEFQQKLQQNNKACEEMETRYKSLSQENKELKESLQSYSQISLQSSKSIENIIRLQFLQEENKRLTDTSQRYEVVVLQNCLISEKLQSYKELQLQNSLLSEKLQKMSQLQVTSNKLKFQIRQLQLKQHNQSFELSNTKNQLSTQISINKQYLQKIQQLQKKDEKVSELSAQLNYEKEINLRLTKQIQSLVSNIKCLQEDRQNSTDHVNKNEQQYLNEIKKYINLIEQNQIIYETQLQKQKQCTQKLQQELLFINAKLYQCQKNQLQSQTIGERGQNKVTISSLKSINLSPKKATNQNDSSFVDYVQVDKEGLLFICELLNIQFVQGGIINKIIQELQNELRRWEISKKYAHFYTQLLEIFGIQQRQQNNELLFSQIKGLKDNLSYLIQKISQEENKTNEAIKNVECLENQLLKNKINLDQLKLYNHQLIILNNALNQQIVLANTKLCNLKLQTKMVLNIIQDVPLINQNQVSIINIEPFFSIESLKAVDVVINNQTL